MEQGNLEERLARLERGVVRGLELLGSGRSDEAHALLRELVGGPKVAPARRITDDELELAFAEAEPDLDQMRSTDDVAQQAILQADLALESESGRAPDGVGEHFATETMAHLLENQGDGNGALRIRAALDSAGARGPRSSRGKRVATLEQWLENLRGGARA